MTAQPSNFGKIVRKTAAVFVLFCTVYVLSVHLAHARATIDHPIVKLRSLDKITARTQVFEAKVGSTVKFGSVFIKVQACRKAPELEQPEAAAFLQIWETPSEQSKTEEKKSQWIFSGWMFASSPGLSSMDHPIYDVWVLDCLQPEALAQQPAENADLKEGEGVLEEGEAPSAPEDMEE